MLHIVPINIISEPGFAPEYKTNLAAGADLKACIKESVVIEPLKRVCIPTGIRLSIPEGFELQVRPRSGLALKNGITILNTPGTVDGDYRGEVGVILINLSDESFTVNPGDRIAQAIFAPVSRASFNSVEVLDETERGEGGFGHTGV